MTHIASLAKALLAVPMSYLKLLKKSVFFCKAHEPVIVFLRARKEKHAIS